jgi:alpha-beta hydrolase superfamily lysophospholipase
VTLFRSLSSYKEQKHHTVLSLKEKNLVDWHRYLRERRIPMGERHFDLKSADGTKLRATAWEVDSPSACVLWVHGFAEYRTRYDEFARYLNGLKYSFVALDLRGHGDSEGKRGFIRSFDEYLADLSALVDWSKGMAPAPLVLGAHSMGGLVLARYLERGEFSRPVEAAVFSGPFMGVGMPVPAWKQKLGAFMSKIIPGLSIPSGLDPALISTDKELVQAYASDPKIFKIATARWFTEILKAQDKAIAEAGRIRLPVLLCQGLGDQVVSVAAGRRFYDGLGSEDRTYQGFEGLYHEILNEVRPAREQVYATFGNWLKKRFPG